MWKFKSWKGKDKCLFLLSVGVILCILAFPVEKLTGTGRSEGGEGAGSTAAAQVWTGGSADQESLQKTGNLETAAVSSRSMDSYEAVLEQRVQDLLKHVDGVGTVDVLIVLKSSAEKVIHTDESRMHSATDEKDSGGGVRKIESEEQQREAVFTGSESGRTPVVEKELYPEISGIVISASGGGNPGVRSEISAAMEALFGLPANKIKVLKRVE